VCRRLHPLVGHWHWPRVALGTHLPGFPLPGRTARRHYASCPPTTLDRRPAHQRRLPQDIASGAAVSRHAPASPHAPRATRSPRLRVPAPRTPAAAPLPQAPTTARHRARPVRATTRLPGLRSPHASSRFCLGAGRTTTAVRRGQTAGHTPPGTGPIGGGPPVAWWRAWMPRQSVVSPRVEPPS
jgi:hypothetical protein